MSLLYPKTTVFDSNVVINGVLDGHTVSRLDTHIHQHERDINDLILVRFLENKNTQDERIARLLAHMVIDDVAKTITIPATHKVIVIGDFYHGTTNASPPTQAEDPSENTFPPTYLINLNSHPFGTHVEYAGTQYELDLYVRVLEGPFTTNQQLYDILEQLHSPYVLNGVQPLNDTYYNQGLTVVMITVENQPLAYIVNFKIPVDEYRWINYYEGDMYEEIDLYNGTIAYFQSNNIVFGSTVTQNQLDEVYKSEQNVAEGTGNIKDLQYGLVVYVGPLNLSSYYSNNTEYVIDNNLTNTFTDNNATIPGFNVNKTFEIMFKSSAIDYMYHTVFCVGATKDLPYHNDDLIFFELRFFPGHNIIQIRRKPNTISFIKNIEVASFKDNYMNNEYHHFILTFDSYKARATVYLNGVNVGTIILDNLSDLAHDADGVRLGANNGDGEIFNGSLKNFNIYDRILSPDQILQRYKILREIKGSIVNPLDERTQFPGINETSLSTITYRDGNNYVYQPGYVIHEPYTDNSDVIHKISSILNISLQSVYIVAYILVTNPGNMTYQLVLSEANQNYHIFVMSSYKYPIFLPSGLVDNGSVKVIEYESVTYTFDSNTQSFEIFFNNYNDVLTEIQKTFSTIVTINAFVLILDDGILKTFALTHDPGSNMYLAFYISVS